MDMIEKIKTLCIARGTSIKALEQELGFSNGSLAKNKAPNSMRLYKISKYFDVPMEYFFEDEVYLDAFKEHERLLSELDNLKKKPLYRASAGEGAYNDMYASENIDEEYECGYEYATVVGDSMLPELKTGDIVKIKPQAETSPSDLSLVKVDGEHATIKYVEIVENGVWIRAINKEVFEDKFYSIQEVMTLPITIIGKVIEVKRKFK